VKFISEEAVKKNGGVGGVPYFVYSPRRERLILEEK